MTLLSFDFLAYYIGSNFLLYMLIHIPLDIATQVKNKKRTKDNAKAYPPWKGDRLFVKGTTVITSLLFWSFFFIWPILHLTKADSFILFFTFEIPYASEVLQYIGVVLLTLGTIVACLGRIARGAKAIAWGVPDELTTSLGYRLVRHPLYASYCYYFIGVPLVMQNYLLLPLVFGIIGYYYTAKYEEEILLQEHQEKYLQYQEKVGMLIPLLGRKKL